MAKSAAATAADEAARAARKARRAAQIAADDAETKDTPAGEEAADIGALFEGLPQESDIRLYRKAKIGGKLEYCQSFVEASEFSEEGVADKWGPGTYRIIARVPDPKTGKPQFAQGRTKTFTIAERPGEALRGSNPRGPENFEQTMAAQMFTMMTGQLGMMQQMMLQGQESHRAMLTMMLSNKPPDTTGELIKLLLPMIMNKADPMDMAVKMAELLKPAGPAASMVDQLAVLEKFMDLAKRGGDEPTDAPVWFRALKEVAPLLERAMTLQPGALQPGPAPQLPPPPALARPEGFQPTAHGMAPLPMPAGPSTTGAGTAQLDPAHTANQPLDLLSELDQTMPFLIKAAVRNGDVGLQVDWFLDVIPEVMYETLDTALADPALLDQLAQRYPSIGLHRAWFEAFVAGVKAALALEEEPYDEAHDSPE